MSTRRWIRRLYDQPLYRPLVDIWFGGPNADGRGLDAINGGYAPAPGLQIVSPSSSTPSSQVRFLIRAADGTWRDKSAGVLAGIGGRVWTGSGWSYSGATEVACIGPMPTLHAPGVTDTVRRYSSSTGRTVSDAPGGLVQPYSQRCDVDDGYNGGPWPTAGAILSSVAPGDQIYWHVIVETHTPELFAPSFGAYADGAFFDGSLIVPSQLSVESGGASGQFAWEVRHRGIGPNGGTVVELWVSEILTQSKGTTYAYMYLLRAHSAASARTLWIHNAVAYKLAADQGRMFGMPPVMLVGAGAVPTMLAESIDVTQVPWVPSTILARLDARAPEVPTRGGTGGRIVGGGDGQTTAIAIADTLVARGTNGTVHNSGVAVPQSLVTVAAVLDNNSRVQFYHNGNPAGSIGPIQQFDGGITKLLAAGANSQHLTMRVRRLMIWQRPLPQAEIATVHNAMAALEGGQ